MRILLDECMPRQLKRALVGHTVATVTEMRWNGIKNGALLRLAENQFDVLVTVDRNIEYQQNLSGMRIALIVLVVRGNKLALLRPLMPQVLIVLHTIQAGQVFSVGP